MLKKIAAALALSACIITATSAVCAPPVFLAPPADGIYHSAHPDFGLRDDLVTADRVHAFTSLAEKRIVWSFVSFHWDRGIVFPTETCRLLHGEGVIPLIGFMPWSTLRQSQPEPIYTLEAILAGTFDHQLRACAREVRSLGFPIMIEFGPEANGSWFPWSGAWNHSGKGDRFDGPGRFRDSYRHIISLFREERADNVTWVFHTASSSAPDAPWNAAKAYYPGDEWIDWIGVSLYGKRRPGDPVKPFDDLMRKTYSELAALSPAKPIALLELGISDDPGNSSKARWIADAMRLISSGRYPRVKAVCWWNKTHRPDGTPSTLEIDSSPESLSAYRDGVRNLVDQPNWRSR